MIDTRNLFHRFQEFIESGVHCVENDDYLIKYTSQSVGLEMGYYSLSKTDLFVGGIKRGHILSKTKKNFSGYKYYFKDDRLLISKRIVDGNDRNIIFLDYENNFCFGYSFDVIDSMIPSRCFAYEMDGEKIIAFKITRGYPNSEKWNEDIIHYEQYVYANNDLIAIIEKVSLFNYSNENERIISETKYDYFNGKYWVPSKNIK